MKILSCFVFQETYLSEHNYDEALDVETAKNILNFGDDYRNFIESNSEVQSPRFLELAKKKRSIRNRVNVFDFKPERQPLGKSPLPPF